MDNSIRKTVNKGAVTIDSLHSTEYQKEGTKTAQLRQVISTTSYYPSKQIKNELQDNPFAMDDFGFTEDEFTNKEERVAFIDVPVAIQTADEVLAKLRPDSCLYRIMSNHPIISSNQDYAIKQGLITLDQIAEKQVVRYGKGHTQEGQLVKDSNFKPQYRQVFFSLTAKEDIDNRNTVADDYYASPLIQSELTGQNVVAGQSLS